MTIPVSMLAAFVVRVLLGIPALRIKDSYPDFGVAPLAIPLLVGLVIGGVATMQGGFVGALVVVFVGEFTRNLGLDILSQALFGVILIFVTFFAPGGIVDFRKQIKGLIIQIVPNRRRVVTPLPNWGAR